MRLWLLSCVMFFGNSPSSIPYAPKRGPYLKKMFFMYRYSFEGVLQAIYGFEREPLVCEDASDPRQCMLNTGKQKPHHIFRFLPLHECYQ